MKQSVKTISVMALLLSLLIFVPQTFAETGRGKNEASTSGSPRVRENLRARLENAKIETVSASTLTVSKDGKTYTVTIATDTQLRRRFGGKSDLIEFSVGNLVDIRGTYTDANKTTITAKYIRNVSIQKRNGVFFGTVKSTGTGTLVLTSKNRGDQTVTIAATTKIVNRKETPITAGDLKVGNTIRVHGLWDRSKNTITEVKEIKNFSLPALPSRSPRASASSSASASASPSN